MLNYVKYFELERVRVQDHSCEIQHSYRRKVWGFVFFDDTDPAQNVRAHQIAVANASSSVWSRPLVGGWDAIPQVKA